MTDLRKALKQGITFEITMTSSYETVIIAKRGECQLFIQRGIKELNDFEQLDVAAQAANRLLAERDAEDKKQAAEEDRAANDVVARRGQGRAASRRRR